MKQTILFISILFIISCGASDKSDVPVFPVPDTTYTTLFWALDITTNEYRVTTGMRVIKDSLMADMKTKTFKKTIDTSFRVWLPEPQVDSTKKFIKSKLYPERDSTIFKWFFIEKEIIIYDALKDWKVNKKP